MRISPSISLELRVVPRNVCGSSRDGLAKANGRKIETSPDFTVVWATRNLPVMARREYSSAARLSLLDTGNNSVPLRCGAESSLTPSNPRASRPKPTVPGV
ncbi:hypothetical protein D3C80_1381080 [compost metagenome]